MKYILVAVAIIIGFYFYVQTFNVTDPKLVSEIDKFLTSKVLYMPESKYETKELVIKPDGYLKYLVTIKYTGVDDGSDKKVGFEKAYRLSRIPTGEGNVYELIGDIKGKTTCAHGEIYFGARKGECR